VGCRAEWGDSSPRVGGTVSWLQVQIEHISRAKVTSGAGCFLPLDSGTAGP
jgi:hypothetical protein